MKLKKIFKNTIIINLALLIMAAVSAFYQPDEVSQISDNLSGGILFSDESLIVGGIIYLVYLVVSLVSLYLIYKLKPSGRKLYTICFVAGLLITLVSGPIIMGPLLTALIDLNVAIEGAILVFLYFTPIKNNFK
tara:strand:+ start:84 stop:485 length:402 start_codon:yes stop_codon:yes gene_type:complete